jgi:hypothetical protein
MHFESAIIERIETLSDHPTLEGGAGVMEDVLSDLGSPAISRQIIQERYRRLRAMILGSRHLTRDL